MNWLNLLIGQPEDPENSADPVNLAESYVLAKDMTNARGSTLRKASRARRIALGERERTYAKPKGPARVSAIAVDPTRIPYTPSRPSLVKVPAIAEVTNEQTGKVERFPYVLIEDRSRYTPEKLRELRRTRR
jgi:hypothetical protein